MKRVQPTEIGGRSHELLLLLGEELKQPLVAISQLAEMNDGDGSDVKAHAKSALTTIDNILLYQKVASGQTSLKLEPVHVGSTMHEVAHAMQPIMRAAGCRTEIIIQHGLSPVDVDRRLLKSALQSLWQGFLGTVAESSDVVCRARRTPAGIRLSLHSAGASIDELHFTKSNPTSSQSLSGVAGSGADFLTAQGIFALLGGELNKSSAKKLAGIGVTLKVSRQLQMI